jgi:autotransporter family porin
LIADGTDITGGFNKSAEATNGGHIELFNLTITQNFPDPAQHGALEVSGGSTISGDHININTSQNVFEIGAFAQGGLIVLKNTTIITPGQLGAGLWAETATFGPEEGRQSTITADNTVITTSGQDGYGAFAILGGIVNLNSSTVTTTGSGANGVYSSTHSTVNVTGSTVTAEKANAGQVVNHSVMNITGSTLTGGTNGIRISDEVHDLDPDTLTVSGSTITATAAGTGQAAIRVEGAEANITLESTTVEPGAQNLFLNVTSIDKFGAPFGSVVNLTASSSPTLNGDILSDADSTTSVSLQNNTTLTGAVNENQLTGASGINPNEPAVELPPQTVNLSIDGTSTWNMRASSTLNTLDVSPKAHVSFADSPFKTLVMNNLTGTGGIFKLNNDLAAIQGDLINILNSSQGGHLVLFNNRTAGSDLPVDTALLVVKTTDGQAVFGGAEDGGTFLYFVRRGNGSSITPETTNWYLVRGDEITPPSPSPSPSPTPAPPGPSIWMMSWWPSSGV